MVLVNYYRNLTGNSCPVPENNFEIYENLNRDDNFPVKTTTRKRLTNRGNLLRRNIDRRSTASDEEPLEELSFRQLSSQKRNSIVAESIISCESEVSTTSTFICSNPSEMSHFRTNAANGGTVSQAAAAAVTEVSDQAAVVERNMDLNRSRTPNESDEDNATQKSKHQRRHAINITSNPGYQVSGLLL